MPRSSITEGEGDLVAYEYSDADGNWFWSVGRILAFPHRRTMTVEPWSPQPRTDLGEDEVKKVHEMMDQILKKQIVLNKERVEAGRIATDLQVKSEEIAQRMKECEAELSEVMPVLAAAKEAVSGVSLKELREVKSYARPPATVKLVMEAVLTVLGQPAAKAADWDFVKGFITDIGFIPKVRDFDPVDMTAETAARVRVFTNNPDFTYDLANRASKAAGPLQKWVAAQLAFYDAIPPSMRPVLEEARSLRREARELDDLASSNNAKIAFIKSELKQMHDRHNEILYGTGAIVSYDAENSPCVTRAYPAGTWIPAGTRRKVNLVRTSKLCTLMQSGKGRLGEYTFDNKSAEAVLAAVNVDGERILRKGDVGPPGTAGGHHKPRSEASKKVKAVTDVVSVANHRPQRTPSASKVDTGAQKRGSYPHPPTRATDPSSEAVAIGDKRGAERKPSGLKLAPIDSPRHPPADRRTPTPPPTAEGKIKKTDGRPAIKNHTKEKHHKHQSKERNVAAPTSSIPVLPELSPPSKRAGNSAR